MDSDLNFFGFDPESPVRVSNFKFFSVTRLLLNQIILFT